MYFNLFKIRKVNVFIQFHSRMYLHSSFWFYVVKHPCLSVNCPKSHVPYQALSTASWLYCYKTVINVFHVYYFWNIIILLFQLDLFYFCFHLFPLLFCLYFFFSCIFCIFKTDFNTFFFFRNPVYLTYFLY